MATISKIEWTEQTWNPVTGCTKVSPGCKNCYAEVMAKRLQAMGVAGYEHGFSKVSLMHDRLNQPLIRRKPTIYFVNSMSDLFQEDVPDEFIDRVFQTISECSHHTFQILTKRSDRLVRYFENRSVPANAWLGVSVENQKYGLPRIRDLQKVETGVRFLSVEPLLEDVGNLPLIGISWVIVGGESGANARPMNHSWVRNIKQQCLDQNVDFFFKQWGAWGEDGIRRSKIANGRRIDGQTWDQIPAISFA